MSQDFIYIDGKIIPSVESWHRPHFVYQMMRYEGNRLQYAAEHLDLLNESGSILFDRLTPLKAAALEQAVAALVRHSGGQNGMPHFVEMRLFADGTLALHINEVSLYRQFAVRAIRPKGISYASQNGLGLLPTSAFQAELGLMRDHLTRQASGAVVIACDNQNKILHIDGGTPIMMRGFEITIGTTPKSVIAQMAATAATKLSDYKVSVGNFTLEEALKAEELLYIDHRGITPLSEVEGHNFAAITAYSIAEHIAAEQ